MGAKSAIYGVGVRPRRSTSAGRLLWRLGLLGLIVGVGAIVAGRIFGMPHASKVGVISLVVVFIAVLAYLTLPGMLDALMGLEYGGERVYDLDTVTGWGVTVGSAVGVGVSVGRISAVVVGRGRGVGVRVRVGVALGRRVGVALGRRVGVALGRRVGVAVGGGVLVTAGRASHHRTMRASPVAS